MARETKVDVYMPLFVGDYLADTGHLSCEEDGAYLRLMMHLWRQDGRLAFNHDQLARICKLTRRRWDAAWVALEPFFEICDGFLTQGRVSHELAIAYGKKLEASRAGKASAEARRIKNGTAQPNAPRTDGRTEPERTFERAPNSSSSSSPSEEDQGGGPRAPARDPGATGTGAPAHLDLPRLFGQARYEILKAGSVFQTVPMKPETIGEVATLTEKIRASGDAANVVPAMRLFWERVKAGDLDRRFADDTALAFGKWRSIWPNLLEAVRGEAPQLPLVAARGSPSGSIARMERTKQVARDWALEGEEVANGKV